MCDKKQIKKLIRKKGLQNFIIINLNGTHLKNINFQKYVNWYFKTNVVKHVNSRKVNI